VCVVCRDDPDQQNIEVFNGVQYIRVSGAKQTGNILIDLMKDLFFGFRCMRAIPRSDVYVVHDFWLPTLISFFKKQSRVVNVIGRYPKHQFFLYMKVSKFVALSRAISDAVVEQSPYLRDRVTIVHNPVDCNRFTPKPELRAPAILFVGRVHPEKGIELLIDAFSKIGDSFPSVPLIIVGPDDRALGGGGAAYLTSLQERSKNLNVQWKGPIFDEDALAREFQSSTVFCYPSVAERGESFPLAPLEAMATGAVTVVSALECFQDAITPGVNGLIFNHRCPDPAQSLAECLTVALTSNDSQKSISESAISRAREFSYIAIARQYLSEFEDLQ
jgi:glycosyltransferase involved in cell wall biosynthesis